jgi:hypothetical protein
MAKPHDSALLHTDIAELAEERMLPQGRPFIAETLLVRNGIVYGNSGKVAHWNYARWIIDLLHPNPSQDNTVRRWYIATASMMQKMLLWGSARMHLQRAKECFPHDADIEFLSGTLPECFASPRAQNAELPDPGTLTHEPASWFEVPICSWFER